MPVFSGHVNPYSSTQRTIHSANQPFVSGGFLTKSNSEHAVMAGLLPPISAALLQGPPVQTVSQIHSLSATGYFPPFHEKPAPPAVRVRRVDIQQLVDGPVGVSSFEADLSPRGEQVSTPITAHEPPAAQQPKQPNYLRRRERKGRRAKPPAPYTTFANLVADIINNSPRKKMTVKELYNHLKRRYPRQFLDGEFETWKVRPHFGMIALLVLTSRLERYSTRAFIEEMV